MNEPTDHKPRVLTGALIKEMAEDPRVQNAVRYPEGHPKHRRADQPIPDEVERAREPSDAKLAQILLSLAGAIEPAYDGSVHVLPDETAAQMMKHIHLAAQRLEASPSTSAQGEISEAINEVLEAELEFREGMGPEWDGDPLTDACDRLRAALSAHETKED